MMDKVIFPHLSEYVIKVVYCKVIVCVKGLNVGGQVYTSQMKRDTFWHLTFYALVHIYLQIFIFYGARSNAELLVNNGFVYTENSHDRLAMKLGLYNF